MAARVADKLVRGVEEKNQGSSRAVSKVLGRKGGDAVTDYAELTRRPYRLAAVQNYLSSGTLFLHSLFDGHPEVLQIPGLAMRKYFDFWAKLSRRHSDGMAPVVGLFMSSFALLFEDHAQEWRDWGIKGAAIDAETFRRHLDEMIRATPELTRKSFLVAVHVAYYLTRGQSIPDNPLIIFPIHGKRGSIAGDMLEDWPGARFIYMVRHPVSAFVSMVLHIRKAGKYKGDAVEAALTQLFLNRTLHGGGYECFGDRPYHAAKRENCRAWRLEYLHEHPGRTLVTMCTWLGIRFNASLYNSTFNGKRWENRDGKTGGFDPELPWRGVDADTTSRDRALIRLTAGSRLKTWQYVDWVCPAWAALVALAVLMWWPFRLERGAYWANRKTLWKSFWASRRDKEQFVCP